MDDTVIVPPRPQSEPSLEPDTERTIIGRQIPAPDAANQATQPIDPLPATAYYSFTVGSHPQVILLDVPCYIGRRPSPPRIPLVGIPRLVRVPSPRREVSSTHLEVRQLGSSVIVTDLKSRNGSIVMMPGSVPRKLRQGESVVVAPGTLVDIGDDNILQILPVQHPGGSAGQEGQK